MTRRRTGLVALLTDFGTRDWYVGTLKGVLFSRVPAVRVVDITHEIPLQDTIAGAFTLAAAAPWFPPGTVFLAIVDPGVGSRRAPLAARADAHYFVGPDNGLLSLVFQQARRLTVVRLTQERYWLAPVSATFHGRDIFAPVAAYLAGGGALAALGVPMARPASLPIPAPSRTGRTLRGQVVHIDAFGNLITNVRMPQVMRSREALRVTIRYQRRPVRVVSSYSAGRSKELVAVVGSLGLIELAVREASAARQLGATRGDEVTLTV